ncbi:aminodeoxychorismate/anthranilate synthase component II [Candidatus Vidania fulgoroideorum]
MILLIDNYDSFTFNVREIFRNLKLKIIVKKSDSDELFEIAKKSNLICIGPGTGSPKKYNSLYIFIKRYYKQIPIIGICLGHQILCKIFKIKIIKSKKIVHGLLSKIVLKKDKIFRNIPKHIKIIRYNSLTAKYKKSSKLNFIGFTKKTNEIMIMKHNKLPILGIQFHPDSHFCKYGKKIIKNFLIDNDIIK